MSSELPSDVVARLLENQQTFLAFLERKLGDRALAEDILQEAFVRGLDKAAGIRNEESAVAWFYRVLRNAVIDHARRHASAQRALHAFAEELSVVEGANEVQGGVCQCVTRVAGTLKPEYAEALQQIEVQGQAVKDFAAEHGISTSNAGVRIFRAREALRTQLARSCGACASQGCNPCTCAKPA